MKTWEINGNLVGDNGFSKFEYDLFMRSIIAVHNWYDNLFGTELLSRYPLFIDNAVDGSGHTPITIPVLERYVIVKLNVCGNRDFSIGNQYNPRIVYQAAHELCHFVFYCGRGISKPLANESEEDLCTAMSFCMLKELCPFALELFVADCKKTKYAHGAKLAERFNFDTGKIVSMVRKEAGI